MSDRLQKAMMALELLKQLQAPQMEMQKLAMSQQEMDARNAYQQQMMEQRRQEMEQSKQAQVLESLSRGAMLGGPSGSTMQNMILDYLQKNYNVVAPPPQVDPITAHLQSQGINLQTQQK